MAEFLMQIAGAVAKVTALFDSTPHYFRPYLTEAAPDFSVTVTEADLRFEQAELDREAVEEGFRFRVFTDPFLERAAIQRAFAEFLFDLRNPFFLHFWIPSALIARAILSAINAVVVWTTANGFRLNHRQHLPVPSTCP